MCSHSGSAAQPRSAQGGGCAVCVGADAVDKGLEFCVLEDAVIHGLELEARGALGHLVQHDH
eukprot:1339065-Rhodomonas_salina.1